MNILHLLSQTHLTGPEVYVSALVKRHQQQGHSCFIISDTLTVKTDAKYTSMSIHNRSILNRFKNIIKVRRFCKQNNIDIIHAHSRASSWIANMVSKICDVSYLSTVHGRQSVHASSKRANVYGDNIICICEHIATHLRTELNINHAKLYLIRNGIE